MICDKSPDRTERHEGLSGATHSGLVNSPVSIRRLMIVHGPLMYRLLGSSILGD
jgi:hypothetical protein